METPTRAAPSSAGTNATSGGLDARLLRRLLAAAGNPPIAFEMRSTGERVAVPGVPVQHTVRLASRATLRRLLLDPQMAFGDAYSEGEIEVSGDLIRFLEAMYRADAGMNSSRPLVKRALARFSERRRNTLAAARSNIHQHYDLGNEFYSLWLGETMAYTCAYYESAERTLDEAQVAKMDHVCRKVRLQPGDRVVEAGCGWGSLALHMAMRYGARVRAFNISREQVEFARRRAGELGVGGQVEFVEDDWRNVTGQYDAFVSVGMLEHVGVANYALLGQLVRRSLTDRGRGLIHSIGRNWPDPMHPWIERRIFPGAYAPALSEMTRIFEAGGLSVLDVENLRLHYALTLRAWLERFEGAADRVRAMFGDESFVRKWRLYLAGSVAGFESGSMQLFQIAFATATNNDIPLTRAHLYRH